MSVGYGLGMFAVGMAVILIGGLIIYKIINTMEEKNDD